MRNHHRHKLVHNIILERQRNLDVIDIGMMVLNAPILLLVSLLNDFIICLTVV